MNASKRKIYLNYRPSDNGLCCRVCKFFVPEKAIILGPGGRPKVPGNRCAVIGIKNGQAYGIDAGHVCEEYEAWF